jgi:hypothetical protein
MAADRKTKLYQEGHHLYIRDKRDNRERNGYRNLTVGVMDNIFLGIYKAHQHI